VYLWSLFGVELRPGQHNYKCPFHDDRRGSLSINAELCRWKCRGCGKQGGLGTLRALARARVDLGVVPGSPQQNTSTIYGETGTSIQRCPASVTLVGWHRSGRLRIWTETCGLRTCPVCGPALAEECAQWYSRVFDAVDARMFRLDLTPGKWRAARKNLWRGQYRSLRVPVTTRTSPFSLIGRTANWSWTTWVSFGRHFPAGYVQVGT
jgi:hypothetical protein